MRLGILGNIGKAIVPKKFQPHLREYFKKTGLNDPPYDLFGLMFFLTVAITGTIFVLMIYPWVISRYVNPGTQMLLIFVLFAGINLSLALIIGLVLYFIYDVMIFKRTQKMEEVLPDFLELVATNLRGGLSLEQSLWTSITPEFSVLSDEISLTAKKVLTGTDLSVALTELGKKYDSAMMRRTMSIIVSEIKSGGAMADILDRMIMNMKNSKKIRMEMRTSVLSYMIFIGAVVIVIAPGLFALSYNIMDLIGEFSQRLASASTTDGLNGIPVSFSAISPDTGAFMNFSIISIILISICSSMIVAMLEKGSIRAGIKYVPIFTGGALACYFLFFSVLTAIFQALF
ncbi:MAG: type II secretion system F family protein [Candidatus Woesearchaeota archaeon]